MSSAVLRLCFGALGLGLAVYLYPICQEILEAGRGGGYAAYGLLFLPPLGLLMVVSGLVGGYQTFRGVLALAGHGAETLVSSRPRANAIPPEFAHLPDAQVRWYHAGALGLGSATFADGRCWIVLRSAGTYLCAKEVGSPLAGEREFLLADSYQRIPNAWTIGPDPANQLVAAFLARAPLPDNIEWLATDLPSDQYSLGPWHWWTLAAKTMSPLTIVPKSVMALRALE